MPTVSVIIPCYNEEAWIASLLEAIYGQTYPRQEMEVVIADGGSTDGTRAEITKFSQNHPGLQVRIVDNPLRNIPNGLNLAIQAAQGEFIVRMDAHSKPDCNYVALCIAALEAGTGDNVGGIWKIQPGADTWIGRAIARAAANPLGAGDARYRTGGKAQVVDTVPFGAFRRSLVDKIGMFDESLLTNEDYEFNVRIRKSGGTVWIDPRIQTQYYARANLPYLFRQYWRYGYWKARMLKRYPKTIRWRQMLPPLFVLSILALTFAGLIWHPFWWLLVFELSVYALVLAMVGFFEALRWRDWMLVVGFPIAIACMHFAWGVGLLWSLVNR